MLIPYREKETETIDSSLGVSHPSTVLTLPVESRIKAQKGAQPMKSAGGTTQKGPPYAGHRRRLRERFEKSNLEGFADYEVVELLLTLAIPRSDVKQPAKELIARFGNLRSILDAPLSELRTVHGLGEIAPVALRIIRAAADLYLRQRVEEKGTKEKEL